MGYIGSVRVKRLRYGLYWISKSKKIKVWVILDQYECKRLRYGLYWTSVSKKIKVGVILDQYE